ncbi:MAG: hypothetical protein M3Y24_08725 [Acidobacteriota bacterium]|nr:hypothetical protein [Acidobacteriota bacterium]
MPVLLDRFGQRAFDMPDWAVALLPLRFSKGERGRIFLGSRMGGRRFLSEEIVALQQVGTALTERIERFRNEQMGAIGQPSGTARIASSKQSSLFL